MAPSAQQRSALDGEPTDPTNAAERRSPAPAVTRAAGILGLLAERGVLSLADISREMALPRSSTLNLCSAMEEARLVRRVEGGYQLGAFTVELGGAYARSFDLVPEFYRFASEDDVLSREILHVATLISTEVLYLARHDGVSRMRLTATIGDRFPASITAVGNILLAQLEDEEVRRRYSTQDFLEAWTERSVTSLDALVDKLRLCRERGYAVDDRETLPGVLGLAVMIPALSDGASPLALGCSLAAGGATPERIAEVIEHLRRARDHFAGPRLLRDDG